MTHAALSPELIAAIESGARIVVANQRRAQWLKLQYARYAIEQGRSAWPTPQIESIDAFISDLWRAHALGNVRVLPTQQTRLAWQRIVAESRWAATLIDPSAAAEAAFRSWERMHLWRIGRSRLLEHAQQSDEARALLDWSDRFAEHCHRHAWLPQALLAPRLLEVQLRSPIHIVTLGEEWPPLHVALFEHLAEQGAKWTALELSRARAEVHALACPSAVEELRSAANWARTQLSSGAQSIGIAVPELAERADSVRRVFAEVFAQSTRTLDASVALGGERARQEASFTLATYRRLADFPLARTALDLLELALSRAASTLVGGVLRNPYLRGVESEAAARALLDARLRAHGREHYDLAALIPLIGDCPILHGALTSALEVRVRAPTKALPSEWAERFSALWRALGWTDQLSLDSEEQQVRARVYACVAEFGGLDELLGPLTVRASVREFALLVSATPYEPRSRPAPITLIDTNAAHEFAFDALWVCGVDAARWPPPAIPDAFLPIALQVEANMPNASARSAREQAERRLRRLCEAAERVVLSYAEREGDIEIRPSPWLNSLPRATAIETAPTYAELVFATRPTLEILQESRAPAMSGSHLRGGARAFELQSHCPFRAFAELRLGATALDTVAPRVAAHERGLLIHAALADVWRELRDSQGLQARSEEQLTTLVRTALAKHASRLLEGASPHRVRMVQLEQELAAERLLELLKLDRSRSPFRVVDEPESKLRAQIGAFTVELRLDRVDELQSDTQRGQHVIIDYKTGNNLSVPSWFRDRPEQPQLPLYAATHTSPLAAVAFATVAANGVGYQGVAREANVLPQVNAFANKYFDLPSDLSEWDGLLRHWRGVIEHLALSFAAGDARVDPLPNACRYCHLSMLCRVHEQALAREAE